MRAQVAAVSEAGRAYVWECRADAGGHVEAALRARVSVRAGCGPFLRLPDARRCAQPLPGRRRGVCTWRRLAVRQGDRSHAQAVAGGALRGVLAADMSGWADWVV